MANASAPSGGLTLLNTRYHKAALTTFMVIVAAHWAEHVVQAVQIWVLGWTASEARGVLGMPFPWLIQSEALHYGYAVVMLAGLFMLRPGFTGRSRTWWNIAFGIQAWHHVEHLLLLVQAMTDSYLGGQSVPTSLVQLLVPRVELHLFYNTIVTAPMIVAMLVHRRPRRAEYDRMACTCAVRPAVAEQPVGV
jgi:hypothetical protein